jgi:hypothetical protein
MINAEQRRELFEQSAEDFEKDGQGKEGQQGQPEEAQALGVAAEGGEDVFRRGVEQDYDSQGAEEDQESD